MTYLPDESNTWPMFRQATSSRRMFANTSDIPSSLGKARMNRNAHLVSSGTWWTGRPQCRRTHAWCYVDSSMSPRSDSEWVCLYKLSKRRSNSCFKTVFDRDRYCAPLVSANLRAFNCMHNESQTSMNITAVVFKTFSLDYNQSAFKISEIQNPSSWRGLRERGRRLASNARSGQAFLC
jgi:hypothetical protein